MTADWWVETLARVSAQAGVLVLLVLLGQWVFRRQLTPHWRCALWLVVMARLILPVSTASRTSLFNLIPRWDWNSAPSPSLSLTPTTPNVPIPTAALDSASTDPLQRLEGTPPAAVLTESAPLLEAPHLTPRAPIEPNPAKSATESITPTQAPSPRPPLWTRSRVLLACWALGALVLGTSVGLRSIRLMRRLAQLPAVTDPDVLSIQDDCARRLGLTGKLPIVESPVLSSPALFGLFRPRLILPVGFLNHFSRQELRYVLLHELAHLRRHDLGFNWLVTALLILHWFNPLLWLGFSRWRADRELACDALALEAAGDGQNREYGQTILHLLERFTHRTSAPGLVGILEDHRDLQRRIGMIATFRPGRRWSNGAMGLLLLLVMVGLTDAQTPKTPTATEETVEAREERVGMDPPLSETESPNATVLTIQVLDPDGQPLPGTELEFPTVGLPTDPPPRRLTDEQGRYLARIPAPPESFRKHFTYYSVLARHPRFAPRSFVWTAKDGDVLAGLDREVTLRLQRGITVGGRIQDERGQPLAGIEVLMTGSTFHGPVMPEQPRTSGEYSDVGFSHTPSPVAVSDVEGRWSFSRYPADLTQVSIVFKRPDGAQERVATYRWAPNSAPPVSMAALTEQSLVTTLKDGFRVRGVVVDERGQPIPGAVVREAFGWASRVITSEVRTDAQGRFERPHRAPREWIYTATAPGRATASVVAQVGNDTPEVRLVLPPAKPWRLHIVDDQGRPVPDARVQVDDYRTEAQVHTWQGRANAEGYVTWTNAPTTNAFLYVSSLQLDVRRKVEYLPGTLDQEVVLSRRMADRVVVTVKAFDIANSQPVPVRAVLFQLESSGPPYLPLAKPESSTFTVEIPKTDFEIGIYPSYRLFFEAAGFETVSAGPFDFDLGDRSLEVAFQRSTASSKFTVLQPNGSPASEVRWWATDPSQFRSLFVNGPGHFFGDQLIQGKADGHGVIELPTTPTNASIILANPSGLLIAPVLDLRHAGSVTLQPYGTIEGQLLVGGRPQAGVSIGLNNWNGPPTLPLRLGYSAITDDDGRFVFRQVPPGEFRLCRYNLPNKKPTTGRPLTETYQQPLTVRSGETLQVTYASTGRRITGQAIAVRPEVEVDWENDIHTLNLKLPPTASPPDFDPNDFATSATFIKARDRIRAASSASGSPAAARTYPLAMNVDGSFQIEDVPPGTYELRIKVTKDQGITPPQFISPGETLGSLVQEVVIPEGTDPLDLGVLRVDVAPATPAPAKPPLAFQATTLSGETLTLSQFRGTNVLLVFWAAWSERSREQLATLHDLQSTLANQPRLAVVTVNLDDASETARGAIGVAQIPGVHCWLNPDARLKLTSELDLETLPSLCLVSANGRVVGRDIEPTQLLPTLRRAQAHP